MYTICHMTSAHKSDDVRIFRKECTSLAARRDWKVYLVAFGESREENNVSVIGLGTPPQTRLERMKSGAKKIYLKSLELDADIYHFHDPELLPYGYKLAKAGKHVIFDSHENTYKQVAIKEYIPKFLRKAIANVYRKKESKWVRDIDAVIFPCPEEGKHPFEGRCKRTAYVNNTPLLSEYYDKYQDAEKIENIVCYVGSLTHERGITNLIKACYSAGAKLILAGDFSSEEYHQKLMGDVSYDCVDYRGFVNREETLDIYKESAIGASIILNVGQYAEAGNLPTKVYEYASMGLPVIMTDYPYAREVNNDFGFAVLVDPDKTDGISKVIIELITDSKRRTSLGEKGRKMIKEQFNWSVEQDTLYSLYDDILGIDT